MFWYLSALAQVSIPTRFFYIWYAFQLSRTNKLNYHRKNPLATEYCKSLHDRALTVYRLFPGINMFFRPVMIGEVQVETYVLLWSLSMSILLFANWSGAIHSLSYRQMDVFMLRSTIYREFACNIVTFSISTSGQNALERVSCHNLAGKSRSTKLTIVSLN